MLIAIVLDRPLAEAKALVEAPNAFIQAVTKIMQDKQNHPVIAQMINSEVNDDPVPSETAASSSGGHSRQSTVTRPLRNQIHNSNKCQRTSPHGCHALNADNRANRVTVPCTIGATSQHKVLMFGQCTLGPVKVASNSKSLYWYATHSSRRMNLI